jgi:DNA-binding NarL/FixJ family response regulator
MLSKIHFALYDDQLLRALAFKRLLIQMPLMKYLFKATSKSVLLSTLKKQSPELLIVNYPFTFQESEDVIEEVRKKSSQIKIIVIADVAQSVSVLKLIDDGANCIISTSTHPKELYDSIVQAMEKEYVFNELLSQAMLSELKKKKVLIKKTHPDEELTPEEIELIKYIFEELTHKEIADKKNVLPGTIDTYTSKLIKKVGAKNVVGLIKVGLVKRIIKIGSNED